MTEKAPWVSRERFTELLHLLQDQAEIQEIYVIAHSMGNQVVLEALAHAIGGPLSRPIGELITAAPDVDRDHYSGIAARVRAVSRGMTLYASSADKALITSRELAGIARAGDVGPDGPVVVDGIEAIDVTAIGTDMFSLNHSEFAHNRSLIDDIGRLLISGSRPPHRRSTQIRPVPEGSQQPVYWVLSELMAAVWSCLGQHGDDREVADPHELGCGGAAPPRRRG